jgi:hypothetical protein
MACIQSRALDGYKYIFLTTGHQVTVCIPKMRTVSLKRWNIFTVRDGCLPKKISLNVVVAKVSRRMVWKTFTNILE